MKLQDFVKAKETDTFLNQNAEPCTKEEVTDRLQGEIERWVASGSDEEITKERVERVIDEYEPYTEKFIETIGKLMEKWGLRN